MLILMCFNKIDLSILMFQRLFLFLKDVWNDVDLGESEFREQQVSMFMNEDNDRDKEKLLEPESTAKSEPKATPTPSSTKVSDTRYHRVYSKCQR